MIPPNGTRIRLIKMGLDDPDPIPPGTTGTVIGGCGWMPEGHDQIWVKWDIERSLYLVDGVDRYEVIAQ